MNEPSQASDTIAPRVDVPAVWERLDPRYITLQRQAGTLWSTFISLFWLGVFVGAATLTPLPEQYRAPLFAFWAAAAAARIGWGLYKPGLVYRHASFRLDGETIEIRGGVFVRKAISVPRSRVQHTDVSQGPFERRHGLGTLHIYTAGVTHALVPLRGLTHARALEIRDALLPREHVRRT